MLFFFSALSVNCRCAEPVVEFTVVRADTLIDLSKDLLVSPTAWREVASLNKLSNPNLILPGQVLRIPTRLLRGQAVSATLVSVVGEVRAGQAVATAGQAVTEGQSLQTGPQSSAVIALADGSRMQLPPSSLAQLAQSRKYGQRGSGSPDVTALDASTGWFGGTLRVLRGSVEVFAAKVLRAKPLEVVTPTAVVGVRGTVYRVGIEEQAGQRTHSEVLEGVVRLDAVQGGGGADLTAGFGGSLAGLGAPVVAPLLAAPDLSMVADRFERPVVRFALPEQTAALRVQVASDVGFEKLVSDQLVGDGSDVRIGDLQDAQWYLRVRRVDAQGIEGFDTTHPFVLKARPQPPAYTAPRSDAKQTVGSIEFAWAQNVGAPRARLQVAQDEAFTQVIQDRDNTEGATLRLELGDPGSYYWRLASIRADGDHGPFGDPQHFDLRAVPEPASLTRAADGSSLVFKWSGARPEDRQQVQLARDPEFSQIVTQEELTGSQWTLPKPSSGGHYYFRYRSIEPDGFVSAYSETLVVEVPRDWSGLLFLVPLATFLVL